MSYCRVMAAVLLVVPLLAFPQWSVPKPVNTADTLYQSGASMALAEGNTVWVSYASYGSDQFGNDISRIRVMRSLNGGETFALRAQLFAVATYSRVFVPTHIIIAKNGTRWILWSWDYELGEGYGFNMLNRSQGSDSLFTLVQKYDIGRSNRYNMLLASEQTIHLFRDSAIVNQPSPMVHTSFRSDGPLSFTTTVLPYPGKYTSDIHFAVEKDSIIHMVYDSTRGSFDSLRSFVKYTISMDNGRTFRPPTIISPDSMTLKHRVRSGVHSGTVVVTYSDENGTLWGVRSSNAGETFSLPVQMQNGVSPYTYDCVIDSAGVHLLYDTYENGVATGANLDSRSLDDLRLWDRHHFPMPGATSLYSFGVMGKAVLFEANDDQGRHRVFIARDRVLTHVPNSRAVLPHASAMSVHPNPFNGSTTITAETGASGEAVIELYNMLGQRVMPSQSRHLDAGRNTIHLTVPGGLSSGIYLLRMHSNGELRQMKIAYIR